MRFTLFQRTAHCVDKASQRSKYTFCWCICLRKFSEILTGNPKQLITLNICSVCFRAVFVWTPASGRPVHSFLDTGTSQPMDSKRKTYPTFELEHVGNLTRIRFSEK